MTYKEHAAAAIRARSSELLALSHRIHAHPELGFEEVQASRWVADSLSAARFDVELGACGLPTASPSMRCTTQRTG